MSAIVFVIRSREIGQSNLGKASDFKMITISFRDKPWSCQMHRIYQPCPAYIHHSDSLIINQHQNLGHQAKKKRHLYFTKTNTYEYRFAMFIKCLHLYVFVDCPTIQEPIRSGEILVGIKRLANSKIKYRYDCVWQLKPPAAFPQFRVFARITSMDLADGKSYICLCFFFWVGGRLCCFCIVYNSYCQNQRERFNVDINYAQQNCVLFFV